VATATTPPRQATPTRRVHRHAGPSAGPLMPCQPSPSALRGPPQGRLRRRRRALRAPWPGPPLARPRQLSEH